MHSVLVPIRAYPPRTKVILYYLLEEYFFKFLCLAHRQFIGDFLSKYYLGAALFIFRAQTVSAFIRPEQNISENVEIFFKEKYITKRIRVAPGNTVIGSNKDILLLCLFVSMLNQGNFTLQSKLLVTPAAPSSFISQLQKSQAWFGQQGQMGAQSKLSPPRTSIVIPLLLAIHIHAEKTNTDSYPWVDR